MIHPWIIAHRGDHRRHIENTLEAFYEAFKQGAQFVELDIQMSKDQVLYVFHDDTPRRFTSCDKPLCHMTSDEIDSLNLQQSHLDQEGSNWDKPSSQIIRFHKFLEYFATKACYYEIKVPSHQWHKNTYLEALGEKILHSLSLHEIHCDSFLASFHPLMGEILLKNKSTFPYARIFDHNEDFEGQFKDLPRLSTTMSEKRIDYLSLSWKNIVQPRMDEFFQLDKSNIMLWDIKGDEFQTLKNEPNARETFKALISDTFFM